MGYIKRYAQPRSEGDNALNPEEAARILPHPGTREGTD